VKLAQNRIDAFATRWLEACTTDLLVVMICRLLLLDVYRPAASASWATRSKSVGVAMKTEIEGQIFHPIYERVISARRPPNFTPPSVRYSLRWRRPVPELVADWFGIQGPELGSPASRDFVERIRTALSGDFSPDAIEIMVCPRDEAGRPVTIVVAYWTSTSAQANWSVGGDWAQWWESPDRLHDGVGYWRETLVCPYDRLETIYSQNTYRIGFGRTPGSEIVKITDNGYFGAARDRLPISAVDEVKFPLGVAVRYDDSIDPRGRRVLVFTPLNTLVMRSGQFWHNSELEQAQDYESSLRPKLDRGMDYLAAHPDTGCIYLRQMINVEDDSSSDARLRCMPCFRTTQV
jgi:aldoxime dehydratase